MRTRKTNGEAAANGTGTTSVAPVLPLAKLSMNGALLKVVVRPDVLANILIAGLTTMVFRMTAVVQPLSLRSR